MEFMESVRAALKEMIIPELDRIKEENGQIKAILEVTNKRLDDVNLHLTDQSRRIDETNNRIDMVREELTKRIDMVREEVGSEIKETNKRLDRLYEVIVRRDEHSKIEERVAALERDVNELKRRIAA
ncbi:MAG: hypothetical protein JRH18_11760 [Deltaproteobacteria bacterium]|nr:hypothetical protein [Deltaproteobacteria bacterium]MBW2152334.1 hypothetical protein [Deltaproteobacteria bacterium]